MIELNHIYQEDCLSTMARMEDESINCCITSPPYYGLRDYGVEGQLGLEKTPEEYIAKLLNIFDEVKRVLRKDGCVFVNIGDTYSGSGCGAWGAPIEQRGKQYRKCLSIDQEYLAPPRKLKSIPAKSLIGIPEMFVLGMRNRGWIRRNTIIWYKRNCMPSSAKDRFTIDFEYVYFFTKTGKYWFEQQFEIYEKPLDRWGGNTLTKKDCPFCKSKATYCTACESSWDKGTGQNTYRDRNMRPNPQGRNKRCVWEIPTQSFPEAHFATFPEKLIEPMIRAGCPENGIVYDPFGGSGTVAVVAHKLKHNWILSELSPDYCTIANKRLEPYLAQGSLV